MLKKEKNYPIDLLSQGMTVIPNILLKYYPAMGITDNEVLVIIHILRIQNTNKPDNAALLEKLSASMSTAGETIKKDLASLIEKKLLKIEDEWDDNGLKACETYILDGLYQRIHEAWSWEHAQKETAATEQLVQISLDEVALLVSTFEKEFGRLLSPFESDKIIDWYHGQSMSTALILEALRRAVMRGIYNFSYIDTILREWRKNNIKTLQDVISLEERKASKASKTGRKQKSTTPKKDKYKDLYMS